MLIYVQLRPHSTCSLAILLALNAEMAEPAVWLGLPGDLMDASEVLDHTVTKAGGLPLYPGLQPPLDGGALHCGVCSAALSLVLQVRGPAASQARRLRIAPPIGATRWRNNRQTQAASAAPRPCPHSRCRRTPPQTPLSSAACSSSGARKRAVAASLAAGAHGAASWTLRRRLRQPRQRYRHRRAVGV